MFLLLDPVQQPSHLFKLTLLDTIFLIKEVEALIVHFFMQDYKIQLIIGYLLEKDLKVAAAHLDFLALLHKPL